MSDLHAVNLTHNRRIERRTMLRSAGLALGLPLLESMTPMARSAFASPDSVKGDSAPPVRMACVFFPNGVIRENWDVAPEIKADKQNVITKDWELSPSLMPLAGVRDKINLIDNLALDNGRSKKDGAGDHARGGATFLTAARPVKTSSNIRLGISVDQVAATGMTGQTLLPSIELGLLDSRNAGSCDSGYSCAYSSNISWRNETQPMPKETIPRLAFERLFGTGDAAAQRKQRMLHQSILDIVKSDVEKLMKQVGQTDRRKLDEYFTSVREIEMRIERTEQEDSQSLPDLEVPFGRVSAFREHVRLMYDLMVVAFQTDTTRIATLMLDNAGGSRSYKEIDVKDSHHGLSHHRGKTENVEKLKRIDHYLVEQFAYFVNKLDATQDAGGSLLDQSMILYGSGLGDGNRHTHEDLPIVVAGGAGGRIEGGRLLRFAQEQPMANLYMSMLDAMKVQVDSIGDSTGTLEGFLG